jgi:hypothetical protein
MASHLHWPGVEPNNTDPLGRRCATFAFSAQSTFMMIIPYGDESVCRIL